jgi:hypothetical protein
LALTARERGRLGVGEVGDSEAFEVFVGALLAGVGDVLADSEVREERVLLEDKADAPLVRVAKEPPVSVQPDLIAESDPSSWRTDKSGDCSEHRGLAGTRWPNQGDGAVDLEC